MWQARTLLFQVTRHYTHSILHCAHARLDGVLAHAEQALGDAEGGVTLGTLHAALDEYTDTLDAAESTVSSPIVHDSPMTTRNM